MPECNFQCRQDERVSRLESNLTELRTELRIYIRQLSDSVTDMRGLIDTLRDKQLSDNDVKNIVRETVDNIKETEGKDKMWSNIVMELLRVIATGATIIGGMQLIG